MAEQNQTQEAGQPQEQNQTQPPPTGIFAGAGPAGEGAPTPAVKTIYSGDPAAAMAVPDPTIAADGSEIPPNTGATLVSQNPAVPPEPPVPVDPPTVTDIPLAYQDGAQLICTMGNWTGEPTGYAYAWHSSGAPVGDQATYPVTPLMVGYTFTCTVTATNAGGSTMVTSDAVTVVEPPVA